jgi:hypothetical protein
MADGNIRVLVANEPRAYREVIAAAFHELRPQIEVIAVEPGDLDAEVVRRHPHLVVCSLLTDMARTVALAWVVLYPGGEAWTVVGMAGQQTTRADIEFDDLVAILDQTELLVGSS